jgi:SAM-dependent methyltransferase
MDMKDPAGSPWSAPGAVAGFEQAPPNAVLVHFARDERERPGVRLVVDLGCGAGRNAVPLAQAGWDVLGLDDSAPMLAGAARRARAAGAGERVRLALATMDRLPVRDRSVDLVVAHGIWNLARTGAEFRLAVREGARVAKPGAALFVFTFSRNTLGPDARPVAGEDVVFTDFSGRPQVFLSEAQLVAELGAVGFLPDAGVPLREYNRRLPGALNVGAGPVIYEAAFRLAR